MKGRISENYRKVSNTLGETEYLFPVPRTRTRYEEDTSKTRSIGREGENEGRGLNVTGFTWSREKPRYGYRFRMGSQVEFLVGHPD